jgi:hypothetical protein
MDADLRRHDDEGGTGGSFISSLGIERFQPDWSFGLMGFAALYASSQIETALASPQRPCLLMTLQSI